jgi:hypothetical protein
MIKMHPPACNQQLSSFRVEEQVSPDWLHIFDLERCFLGEEFGMEGVDGEERVAELTVPEAAVSVLVVSVHVQHEVLRLDSQAEVVEQSVGYFFGRDPTLALGVKQTEGVNQVEIGAKSQINLNSF